MQPTQYYKTGKQIHINEIEKFFNTFDFNLVNEIKLNSYTKVENVPLFVASALHTLREHKGDKRFQERYDSLLAMYYTCKELNELNKEI